MTATCPYCAFRLVAPEPINRVVPPVEGDISICGRCGEFSIYGPKAESCRPVTNADLREHEAAFAVASHVRSRIPIGPRWKVEN